MSYNGLKRGGGELGGFVVSPLMLDDVYFITMHRGRRGG
jgi:hypothetical protein